MGLWEILKDLIPEKLINVEQRKIIYKNNVIVIGDQTIENNRTINNVLNKLSEQKNKESLPFQLIHEDLLDDFEKYEELSIRDKQVLKKLKRILPQDEVECILMARRVCIAYDENKKELAEELLIQLEKNYPRQGKKVRNLIGANYFDELILPFIDVFYAEYGEKEFIGKFRKFYEGLLQFFPVAIFVGNSVNESQIEKEINKRLRLKNIPFIRIHSLNEFNIRKVESVTEKMEIDKKYTTKVKRYTAPTGLKAHIYEIRFTEED